VTADPIVAEVLCPRCRHLIARIHQGPGGRLSVEYRSPQWAENSDHLDRPLVVWDVKTWQITADRPSERSHTVGEVISWGGAECACKNARGCGSTFILERSRVRELVERHGIHGGLVRWHPAEVDMRRSDCLRPTLHFEEMPPVVRQQATLAQLSPPPPLEDRNIRIVRPNRGANAPR
jgi:hypothetical protein